MKTKINIGGGPWARKGWHNLEWYSKNTATIQQDLRKCLPIPLESNTMEKAFSSHCIEHLEDYQLRHLFSELYRIMKHGAVLRLSCPDADLFYKAYGENNICLFEWVYGRSLEEKFINCFVSYEGGSGVPNVNPAIVKKNYTELSKEDFLNWAISHVDRTREYIAHINWLNYPKLSVMLAEAGFTDIEKSGVYQSKDEEFRDDKDFDLHHGISLFIECRK